MPERCQEDLPPGFDLGRELSRDSATAWSMASLKRRMSSIDEVASCWSDAHRRSTEAKRSILSHHLVEAKASDGAGSAMIGRGGLGAGFQRCKPVGLCELLGVCLRI